MKPISRTSAIKKRASDSAGFALYQFSPFSRHTRLRGYDGCKDFVKNELNSDSRFSFAEPGSTQFHDEVINMSLRHLFVAVVISLLASCSRLSTTDTPTGAAPVVYINQNLGFDVPGYKYNQADIPCDIESSVVESVIRASAKKNIRMEAVNTSSKINNAAGIPVLAIDIVRLVLGGKGKQFGVKTESELPAIKIKAAVFSNNADKSVQVKEHGCAILVLNEFTPSSNVLDMGTAATVCSATRKCIDELSADLVDWMAPLIQKR